MRNPSIVILQRRLFCPAYQGPGKWVTFEPQAHRAFLAINRQEDPAKTIPPVLRYLIAPKSDIPDAQRDQMIAAGLFLRAETTSTSVASFFDLFQRSVFDYPFLDYSTSEAFDEDASRMRRYAASSSMPPIWTHREGSSVSLPEVSLEDLGSTEPGIRFDLRHLSVILRCAFGSIGTLGSGPDMHLRKSSPSGGAKHPTEGWIQVDAPWSGLARGSYVYDGQNHRLIAASDPYLSEVHPSHPRLYISIRSRVERAMWRYRDPRSSRAVLIDAGHVIETLTTLLTLYHAPWRISLGPRPDPCSVSWLREPEVARIILAVDTDVPTTARDNPDDVTRANVASFRENHALLTNPAMYFVPQKNGFAAKVLNPVLHTLDIDITDFMILTYCIQSHRGGPTRPGDRVTTPGALRNEFTGATTKRVSRLAESGALLPVEEATALYNECRRWAEHGWYLPLLAWVEAANTVSKTVSLQPRRVRHEALPVAAPQMGPALRARVTTRSFSTRSLTQDHLSALLQAGSIAPDRVNIYVTVLNVDGLDADSLYLWQQIPEALVPLARTMNARQLVQIMIGQQWVAKSAAALWIMARSEPMFSPDFFAVNLLLGQIAQRICIRATASGIGVFQTPAVRDRLLSQALGVAPEPSVVPYTVCVGWPTTELMSTLEDEANHGVGDAVG